MMLKFLSVSLRQHRGSHTSVDSPSPNLKKSLEKWNKLRKRGRKSIREDELFVPVPESKYFLDTATMPMILTAIGITLFVKLLMMYDDEKAQERLERKIKKAPAGTGTIRMLTREEWENIQEVRPRTPFESKLARPNARIRTGETLHFEDMKDWTVDVLTDAVTRVEESVRHNRKAGG